MSLSYPYNAQHFDLQNLHGTSEKTLAMHFKLYEGYVKGAVLLIQKSVSYTTREKVLDLGSIEATAKKKKTIPISPILGVISLVGGSVLIFVGSKNKNT